MALTARYQALDLGGIYLLARTIINMRIQDHSNTAAATRPASTENASVKSRAQENG